MNNIILMGGIHGVGKTTTGEYCAKQTGLKFISAGEILINNTIIKEDHGKSVSNIKDIQDLLILGLKDIINPESFYLLDGHFCLIDESGQIKRIPISVFKEISLIAIIILTDSPLNIKKKIKKRDGLDFTVDFLDTMQKEEKNYGLKIASSLKIPCFIFNIIEPENIILKIKELLEIK